MSFKNIFGKTLKEEVSQPYKDRIFQAVLPELKKNKSLSRKRISWILVPTLCLLAVTLIQFNMMDTSSEDEAIMFSQTELEFFSNLDVIENLVVLDTNGNL